MSSTSSYSPWADLASRPEINFEWSPLVGRMGEYLHSHRLIRLRRDLPRRVMRSVLAHELRHADMADELTVCGRVNLRQEQRADREAARLLIDVRELGEALVVNDGHLSGTAVSLRVSDYLLGIRLASLHPSERHYLRRRLAD